MAIVSFSRRLADKAAADPSRLAITCGVRSVTRAELETAADALARQLLDDGVQFGDMVTIALPNSVDWFIAVSATWKIGAIPNPSRHGYRLASWRPSSSWPILRWSSVPTEAPFPIASVDPSVTSPRRLPPTPNRYLTAISPAWKAPTSGGSTGRPKLIVTGEPGSTDDEALPPLLIKPEGCMMMPGPLYHNGPIVWASAALLGGNHVVVLPRFDAEATLAGIEEHRSDIAYLVPTMMKRIWRLPVDVREGYDLSSLRLIWHLAEPCPPWLKDAWIEWLGPERIMELYGGTEGQTQR